jgi:hypothetical protein
MKMTKMILLVLNDRQDHSLCNIIDELRLSITGMGGKNWFVIRLLELAKKKSVAIKTLLQMRLTMIPSA